MTELIAERNFVALAQTRLTALRSGALSATQSAGAFQDIMSAAQSVKARAVMMSARQCRDKALSSSATPTQRAGVDIQTLGHLIDLFTTGLLEIDPGARRQIGQNMGVNGSLADTSNGDSLTIDTDAKAAATALSSLIQYAPSENQSSLTALMRLSGQSLTREQAAMDKTSTPESTTERLVSLESVMAPVTSGALMTAHMAYKQVSLSYACEGIVIHSRLETPLQDLIGGICEHLIAQSVRHPGARETAGLSSTAQISLTASDTQSGLMIDIFCDDLSLPKETLAQARLSQEISKFSSLGGAVALSGPRPNGVLFSVSHPAPRSGPRQIPQTGLSMPAQSKVDLTPKAQREASL